MVLDSPKFPRAEDKGMTISIGVQNHHIANGVCSFEIHRMLQAYAQLLYLPVVYRVKLRSRYTSVGRVKTLFVLHGRVTITRTKAEDLTEDIGEMIGIWPVLDPPDYLVGLLASMPVYSSRESI